jgi:hypothetical protein
MSPTAVGTNHSSNGLDLWITCIKFRFNDSGKGSAIIGRGDLESDIRFYRRRASEELSAANRAVTKSARERRMLMAGIFLDRLKALEPSYTAGDDFAAADPPAFQWANDLPVEPA